ncbi:MAG: helix-turn-helix domain-containing protein [Myxococcota bacterium]
MLSEAGLNPQVGRVAFFRYAAGMASESTVYALVLGRVIAALRERRGWSQAQLAARIGVAQSSLSRFETGASIPDAYTFRRIAQAFDMSVGQLQAVVDRALAQTQQTAQQAAPAPSAETPWWQVALGVAGAVGLAGLVAFAVAAAVNEGDEEE